MTMFPAGRTIVITGGGRGIGEEAVKKFLMKGAKVRRYNEMGFWVRRPVLCR